MSNGESLLLSHGGGTVPSMSSDSSIIAATELPPCNHPFYASTGIRANANAKWVDVNSKGELKFENRSSEHVGSCVWAGELVYFYVLVAFYIPVFNCKHKRV